MDFSTLKKFFGFDNSRNSSEVLKLIFLAISFFLIIGAYTVARELKDSVFSNIIGIAKENRKYYSYARILSFVFLIPVLFIHAKIIDKVKKYQILSIYTLIFGLTGLIFALLLGHSTIGLYNTIPSANRIFGWLFYLFIEGYSPLLVSLFWAFTSSITTPQNAKTDYTTIVAASKIGGIIFAGSSWLLLKSNLFNHVIKIQILLGSTSMLLLFVPITIYYLVKFVPKKDMHGYEAAYIANKDHKAKEKETYNKKNWFSGFLSMLSGLTSLFKYPYVMGILALNIFFEVVNQVIKVENIIFAKTICKTMSDSTAFLMLQAWVAHILGLFIVIFGTKFIISALGELKALMLVPTLTGMAALLFIIYPKNWWVAFFAFVITRAVNYALAVPLKETLYIPTINEIRFKTKSWVDGMGSKFAKMASNAFNIYIDYIPATKILATQSIFFALTISFWMIISYALGKKFETAVKNNEVIGG